MKTHEKVSTGIPGFDKTIDMLRMGDNVVWQVDHIEDYCKIVKPYVEQAKKDQRRIVYFRFGTHPPVLEDLDQITVYEVDASLGFESFATKIHQIIDQEGVRIFYVFDCLTELLQFWYSDMMIANFFKVTCPFLYVLDTVAYFAVKRNLHTYDTIARIRETTQCLLDIYEIEGKVYIHPLKVWERYSPTMFFPHLIEGEEAVCITASSQAVNLFANVKWSHEKLDYWNVTIERARNQLDGDEQQQELMKKLLVSIFMTKSGRMSQLCNQHFNLRDLLWTVSREIGTGYIGGKSVGMLLARKIIKGVPEGEEIRPYLDPDDSFFIGTDVFYTYIVQNGWWDLRMRQKTEEGYFKYAQELHDRLLEGSFPEIIENEFMRMLEYFGQSPIIVRSSSLQEDNFGNAFAGKYESVFCVNQGTPEERLLAFEQAVRTVYASTMNLDALKYRIQRGLDEKDEQMAILVQRVSGDYFGDYFFPHAAGVGNSSNLYVWEPGMDMNAGMLRLVFGLGTRAVDRVIGDYVRIVPLDDPARMPLMALEDEKKFSQHKADVLNVRENKICSMEVNELMKLDLHVSKSLFAAQDYEEAMRLRNLGYRNLPVPYTLNFKKMLSQTAFPDVMRKVLNVLSSQYDYPVDIEFTVNFTSDTDFKFNLVQCRPLQTRGLGKAVDLPSVKREEDCLLYSEGNFMGGNVRILLDYVVFVDVREYLKCTEQEKYSVARHIGKVNEAMKDRNALLIGPGRWGTTTPSLGVPVHFMEISNMAAMCEVAYSKEGLMPELSYGSHFFQDLVETGIFYIALFKDREDVIFRPELLEGENLLEKISPDSAGYSHIIRVAGVEGLELYSDIVSQRVLCVKSREI